MAVELSDDEFDAVYAALRKVTQPYNVDDIGEVVVLEYCAWQAISAAGQRAGRPACDSPATF